MAKKTSAPADEPNRGAKYDAEALSRMCLKVKVDGFVPAADLKAEFGPEKFTQGIALLFRDFRMFREVRRTWGEDGKEVLGYEWADPRFSQPATRKIEAQLGFSLETLGVSSYRPKYGDFEPITVKCVWVSPILGSVPIKDEHSDPVCSFERDHLGNFLIFRYHQRAMAKRALQMLGKEMALAYKLGFSIIRIPSTTPVKIVEHGIVDEQGNGLGIKRSEFIADGVEFEIRALIPTSVISADEFLRMLNLAGQYVGLSPGRSAGFGDFEVLSAS